MVNLQLTLAETRMLLKGNEFRQWRMGIQDILKLGQTICGILVDKYILKKCEEDSFVPGRLSLVASIMNLTLMIFVISMFLFICLEI